MASQAQVEVPYQETVLYRIRHSAAHIMAQAVLEIFPEGKISIGPPVDDGFYYDFDLPRSLTPEDLEKIEERMKAIIKGDFPFIRREISAQEARDLFKGQPYKLELIDGLEKGGVDEYGEESQEKQVISTYKQDTFEDLCRGPHVEKTGQINPDAIKLMSIAEDERVVAIEPINEGAADEGEASAEGAEGTESAESSDAPSSEPASESGDDKGGDGGEES